MMDNFYVWYFPKSNEVLLTDDPGPPIDAEFVGAYPRPEEFSWGSAGDAAKEKAEKTGALLIYDAIFR